MANVTFNGTTFACATAIKGSNYIHLLDADGCIIVAFEGVKSFTPFSISNGSWVTPTEDNKCPVAVMREDGTVAKGEHTCEDIGIALSQSIAVYSHLSSTLNGSGTNGKFKATETGTYTAFTIGDTSYAVRAGSETEIELTSGVWYSFILDTGAKTINFKAGGAGLNFKIVGGTTQPTSPKENTIWISTSTTILEYQFSTAQPTKRAGGAALQSGDVWIKTGTTSPTAINIAKKNGINIYPVAAYQWNGSTWVEKTMKVYKDKSWVSNDYYLFDATTGINRGTWSKNSGELSVTNASVHFSGPGYTTHYAACSLGVDVTNYNTLTFHVVDYVRGDSDESSDKVGLYNQPTLDGNFTVFSNITGASADIKGKTFTVDITDLTGTYYVKISNHALDGDNTNLIALSSIKFS